MDFRVFVEPQQGATYADQLAVVTAIVLLTSAVFATIAVQRLAREAESTALAVAQSVASDTDVREQVALLSVDGTEIDQEALARGALQRTAVAAQQRTGALFVVVTDDRGVRLAHPDPSRIGERVSTSPDAALRGEEVVAWERGTLGEAEAVALVGAGMLSLLAFPLVALARLPAHGGRDRVSPPG